MEIWKDVNGFEGYFQISNYGRVKQLEREVWNGYAWFTKKEKMLKISYRKAYPSVRFYIDNKVYWKSVHRLIAEAFIPNPHNKSEVNHINGIKTDFNIDNLEWVTRSENQLHAFRTGLNKPHIHKGSLNPSSKLNEIDIINIRNDKRLHRIIAESYGISRYNITNIKNHKRWAHIK